VGSADTVKSMTVSRVLLAIAAMTSGVAAAAPVPDPQPDPVPVDVTYVDLESPGITVGCHAALGGGRTGSEVDAVEATFRDGGGQRWEWLFANGGAPDWVMVGGSGEHHRSVLDTVTVKYTDGVEITAANPHVCDSTAARTVTFDDFEVSFVDCSNVVGDGSWVAQSVAVGTSTWSWGEAAPAPTDIGPDTVLFGGGASLNGDGPTRLTGSPLGGCAWPETFSFPVEEPASVVFACDSVTVSAGPAVEISSVDAAGQSGMKFFLGVTAGRFTLPEPVSEVTVAGTITSAGIDAATGSYQQVFTSDVVCVGTGDTPDGQAGDGVDPAGPVPTTPLPGVPGGDPPVFPEAPSVNDDVVISDDTVVVVDPVANDLPTPGSSFDLGTLVIEEVVGADVERTGDLVTVTRLAEAASVRYSVCDTSGWCGSATITLRAPEPAGAAVRFTVPAAIATLVLVMAVAVGGWWLLAARRRRPDDEDDEDDEDGEDTGVGGPDVSL
jgi:hypothetical protein